MRILVWHVHGGWMEAFVRGGQHEYLLPKSSDGGAWGFGGEAAVSGLPPRRK